MIQYSGLQYTCAANDSFDSVAMNLYGHEKYAADLMNANPSLCGKSVFDGGETLLLPVLDLPSDDDENMLANTIAPWKT